MPFINHFKLKERLYWKIRSALICLKPKSYYVMIDVQKKDKGYYYNLTTSRFFTQNAINAYDVVTQAFINSAIENDNANKAVEEAKELLNA